VGRGDCGEETQIFYPFTIIHVYKLNIFTLKSRKEGGAEQEKQEKKNLKNSK
jgi:3-dehydroquinate dehydratase